MSDLPLIGGHAPGTSAKAHSETCVNLFIEARGKSGILRNRPGYELYGTSANNVADDPTQAIDNLTVAGDVCTIDHATIRYGYEVGDSIDITGATDTDFNNTWTIVTVSASMLGFTIALSQHSVTPTTETDTSAVVQLTGGKYRKEIRYMWRLDLEVVTATFLGVVVGNRLYMHTPWTGMMTELSTAAERFLTTRGAIAGAHMGDAITDGITLCDGVAGRGEQGGALTMTCDGEAWDTTTLSVKSNTATFMDGYIIRDDRANPGRFVYSDLYNSGIENPFNFATAEGSPDDLLAVLADRRELWLFGEDSTEIWYNAGGKDLPFARCQGGFVELGIGAPLSAKKFDNSVVWLASDDRGGLTVVRAGDGYQPMMISTEAVNVELNKRNDYVFNASAQVMRFEGHEFYILTIPGTMGQDGGVVTGSEVTLTPITLVYDNNSKEWFKWKSHDDLLDDDDEGRWMVTAHIHAHGSPNRHMGEATTRDYGNVHFVGGRDNSGTIYRILSTTFMDEHYNGNQVIECERTLPAIYGPENMRVNAGPIELVTDADAGENISVDLSYAKDGKSFIGTPVTRAVTANSSRLMWKKVGRARHWIFKVAQNTTATLPVRWLRLLSKGVGQ